MCLLPPMVCVSRLCIDTLTLGVMWNNLVPLTACESSVKLCTRCGDSTKASPPIDRV